MPQPVLTSAIDYSALGDRLRACRMGAGLQAHEVAGLRALLQRCAPDTE
ncbi:MAG: hypothetical protein ITG01_04035 [Comamonas sp.]|nr:hypothetical protein [Comamonas sp.]